MGQILIRNLDDRLIETLKCKAKSENTSLEQYLRDLLAETVQSERDAFDAFARGMRERSRPSLIDPTDLIREDRDR